jgi:hypothetical protein
MVSIFEELARNSYLTSRHQNSEVQLIDAQIHGAMCSYKTLKIVDLVPQHHQCIKVLGKEKKPLLVMHWRCELLKALPVLSEPA